MGMTHLFYLYTSNPTDLIHPLLDALTSTTDDLTLLRTELLAEQEAALAAADAAHSHAMAMMLEQCDRDKSVLTQGLEEHHAAQTMMALQEQQESTHREISTLRKEWGRETAQLLQIRDVEYQQSIASKLSELAETLEAEKARALKLEASKWKQALKEAEKRAALEVTQAKSQGREEREAELRQELAMLEESKVVEHEAAELRHRAAMDALLTEHELKFLQWKTTMDTDRQEALQRIENVTRDMVSEDWAHRLQLAVDEAVEKADAVSKAKVSKQQEALEEFKRDMIVQTQRLADERNDLQQRCEDAEASLVRCNKERRIEVDRLQHDFEDDREALVAQYTTKHQREIELLTEKLTKEIEQQREAAVGAATKGLEQRLEQAHRDAIEQVYP